MSAKLCWRGWTVCRNCQEAVKVIKDTGNIIVMVIPDRIMPGMDGGP